MSKTEKTMVPELRFPEFANDGEWEVKTLKNVCHMQAGKFVSASEIKEKTADDLFPCYGGNGLRGYTESFTHIGDFPLIGRQGALCGNITFANGKFHATEHAVVTTPKKEIDTAWLFYVLTHLNLNQYATGQAQPGLSVDNLEKLIISVPQSEKEQKKIADCLSSLDEVITVQTKKIDALKTSKKGLLQNVFPQEGESVPKLRFPEFGRHHGWIISTIGDIAQVGTGGTPASTNKEYWNGDIPWMNSGELNDKRIYSVSNFITSKGLSESSTKLIPPYCVLIGLAGQGKTRGTAAINYIELCTNQSIAAIYPNDEIFISEFLFHKIDSMYEKLRQLSAGDGGRGGLNLQIIKAIELFLPSKEEQQKIADCLTLLDNLITQQTGKVEALKAHKKGLMQQLFPNIIE